MPDDSTRGAKLYDSVSTRGLAGKRDYVRSLEQRRDEEAMSLLVECLCDESWYLRELAEHALLRLGDRAGETLIPLLEQGLWFSRSSAARVLGRLGYTPAVPALLALIDDANATVASSALAALVELGHRGGSARIAFQLNACGADDRRLQLERVATLDRPLAERISRLFQHEELMSHDAPDELRDDSPLVRASEEGVVWEVLTGPPRPPGGDPPVPLDP